MNKCKICKKAVNKRSPAITCCRCDGLVHERSECSGLNNKQRTALRAAESLEWVCNDCQLSSTRKTSFVSVEDDDDDEEEYAGKPSGIPTVDTKKLFANITKEVNKIVMRELAAIVRSVEHASAKIDEFDVTIKDSTKRITELEKKQIAIKNHNTHLELKVAELEQRLEAQEQAALMDHIEIVGIPFQEEEDVMQIARGVGTILQVLGENHIRSARRVSTRKGKAPIILVQLTNEQSKANWTDAGRRAAIRCSDVLSGLTGEAADQELIEIRKVTIEKKILELTKENAELVAKVDQAKAELIRLETCNGKKQYPLPGKTVSVSTIHNKKSVLEPANVDLQEPAAKKEKKETKKKEKVAAVPSGTDSVIDVRKLDFRIGKIIEINKHPDADSLYVEKIDCGEANPRTVVSGLVNHVPIEEMKDRIVMVLCNLKPVKMRGVTSEAMVMCASSPAKVEVLLPPPSATPGDLVECEGYPREPEAQLNPKKKIFETCAPDLQTNNDKVACYKGSPLLIPGKGPIVAPTLKDVNVK